MKKKLLRRGFAAILAVLLCLSLLPAALAAGDPTIEVASVEAKAGETVKVTISLKNNPGITLMKLLLDYDESKLELVPATVELPNQATYENVDDYIAACRAAADPVFGDDVAWNKDNCWYLPVTESGKVVGLNWMYTYSSAPYGYVFDGVFATLTFKVKDGVTGEIPVSVKFDENDKPAVVTNETGSGDDLVLEFADVDFTVTAGKVTVKGDEPAGVRGDVNGDGKLTSADAMLAARSCLSADHRMYKALTAEQILRADIDGNGTVTSADVMRIARACLSPDHRMYKALD